MHPPTLTRVTGGTEEWRIDPADWPRAIGDTEGPQLVVAGPGTGKTEFLVRRAVYLIDSARARPDQLLILTFSRRGAARLRRRILDGIGRSVAHLTATTFHAFAHGLVEAHGPRLLGWEKVPSLLTGPEQVGLVSELLRGEAPDDWPQPFRALLGSPSFAEEVADFLLRCRERLVSPERLEDLAQRRRDWRALPGFFRRYESALAERRRLDYGALLAAAIRCLDDATTLAADYRYLLVDEYQDTSPAQVELLAHLSAPHRNITVAADPYQSIYSFRGAELTNVAAFTDRFRHHDGSPARRLVLTTSFRVPAPILEAALRVTSPGGLPGGSGPVTPAPHPGRVDVYLFDQSSAEAEWIASELERLHLEEGLPYSQMAVLVRTKRALLPELSRALERRRIPHDQPDSRLVDHPAVQMVFDLVRAATGPASSDETDRAVRRLLLGPLFALPVGAERDVVRHRIRHGRPWADVLRETLPEAAELADLLEDTTWATHTAAADGFWEVWTRLPQFERLVTDPSRAEHRSALASFSQTLARQVERDPSVSLADYLRLVEDDDFEATPLLAYHRDRGDRLVLTTLHQAKGLEFEVVVIADATEGVFPDTRRARSLLQTHLLTPQTGEDPAEITRFRLQEEMRLAYTATTRARRRVVWTATAAGIDEGDRRPSRFLTAVAGVASFDDLHPPPSREGPPVSLLEVEAHLRRLLTRPEAPAAERLAAAAVLAHPPTPVPWDPERMAGVRSPGSDQGVIDPPLRLSPSQAESYEQCPRRYLYERRLRAAEVSSSYATFGSVLHDVLEEVEHAALEQGRHHSTLEEALACLERHWERVDFGGPVLSEAWKRRGERLLNRLYAEWPEDSRRPVALEHDLRMEIDGIEWQGRADRIEQHRSGELRVVDYKTSASTPAVKEAAVSLQLGFYLMAAATDPHLSTLGSPTAAELWHPLARGNRWRYPFDLTALPTVASRMQQVAEGLSAEDWTPRVGQWCGRCPVRVVCDRWPEGREAYLP